MKLWQLLLCATMIACSGDDDGPKPAADAGDGGPDSGLDGGDACVGDACAPVGPKPLGEERLFEPNASVLGRVVSASGAPLTGYAVQVFDIPSTGAARGDVSFAPAVDGSFRLRLTGIPSQAPEGTPPAHVVLKISAPGALTAAREVVLHPREITDLGSITLILRDPKVTVIGAAGGTATDSSGEIEVVIPPGALSTNVPVQITPTPPRCSYAGSLSQVDWPTSAADGWSAKLWRETVDYASGGPLGPADIMYLTASVLCGRRSMLSAIEDLLHPFGTFLEARVADDVDLFLFRPHVRPGAVDRERSSFVRFPSGKVMLIQSLEFRRDAIEGIPIFSTDVRSAIDVYFSAAFLERLVRAKVRLGTETLKVWEG